MADGLTYVDNTVLKVTASYMKLFYAVDQLAGVARTMEDTARQAATRRLAKGLPAYLKLDGVEGIVRQMPDGKRHLVELVEGKVVVLAVLPPGDSSD